MSEMDDTQRERIEDLTAAYVLGALTEEERLEFEALVKERPDLQAEVEELGALANLLALAPQEHEPAPELRRDILRSVGAAPEAYPSAQRASWRDRVALIRLFGPGGLAAAAAGVVVFIGLLAWALSLQNTNQDLRTEVAQQRRQTEALRTDVAEQQRQTQVLSAKVESRRTLDLRGSGVAEGARGQVLLNGEGRAVLVADELPPAPEGMVYEAWLLRDGVPEPAGLFAPREDGSTAATVEGSLKGAEAIAVTVEPEEGSPMPTSDIILTASLA